MANSIFYLGVCFTTDFEILIWKLMSLGAVLTNHRVSFWILIWKHYSESRVNQSHSAVQPLSFFLSFFTFTFLCAYVGVGHVWHRVLVKVSSLLLEPEIVFLLSSMAASPFTCWTIFSVHRFHFNRKFWSASKAVNICIFFSDLFGLFGPPSLLCFTYPPSPTL